MLKYRLDMNMIIYGEMVLSYFFHTKCVLAYIPYYSTGVFVKQFNIVDTVMLCTGFSNF